MLCVPVTYDIENREFWMKLFLSPYPPEPVVSGPTAR